MANVKKIILDFSETGVTLYAIIRMEVDSYRMNDVDGSFALNPADPYILLTEDSVIKGRYELSESRAVWDDGEYTAAVYMQTGGSPVPADDMIIASWDVWIYSDIQYNMQHQNKIGSVILPVMQASVYTATATQKKEVKIKRGDTTRIYFDLGGGYTGWDAYFGAKSSKNATSYIIAPAICVWTDVSQGQGYKDLSSSDTGAVQKLYAEIELRQGSSRLTAIDFILIIEQDIIV